MPPTSNQLLLLSHAAQRDDHLVTPPDTIPARAARSAMARLLHLGLAEEIPGPADQNPGRLSPGGQPFSLRITDAGFQALGLQPSDPQQPSAGGDPTGDEGQSPPAPRAGSKRAFVLNLLSREEGASLDDLVSATGWLPHTTRATLTGLRKAGYRIVREQDQGGRSIYRILLISSTEKGSPEAPAAGEAC